MNNSDLELAKNLYQTKDLIKSETLFQKVYQTGTLPEQVEAAFFLEKIYGIFRSEFFKIKPYFEFITKYGDDNFKGQAYMELGIYYRNQKSYVKMFNFYQEALKYIPNDLRLITEVANYYLSKNEEESQELAQYYFKKILEINVFQKDEYKHLRNQNMAYIGLVKSYTKQRKIGDAKETLNLVVVQNVKDKEEINKCFGNLAVMEEKYAVALSFFQNNLKSHNQRVVDEAAEKIGLVSALMKDYDKVQIALEPFANMPNGRGNYANLVLGKIYFHKKDYQKSCNAYMRASKVFNFCLFYALKSAMFYDENKAVEIGNIICSNKRLLIKYRAYLLYLSKKYNIFFPDLSYKNLNDREEEIIEHDMLAVYSTAARVCSLDYNLVIEPFCIYEQNLEEEILNLEPNLHGGYYDSYFLKPQNVLELENMYFVVNTLKDTKTIIEIRIIPKEKLNALNNNNIFANQMPIIRSLFR